MAKVLHLSKLSRGHVELSESGSRLEIFADHTVYIFLLLKKKRENYLFSSYSIYTRKDHLFILQETMYQKRIQQSNKNF
jgi:hypothetical protein